jgi:UDP-4-amino-4,6-dideoxy-N-acetyl-beta-L-altrosamine transaminase
MTPIPYGRQDIQPEDIQAVIEALQSDFLTGGPAVAEFERAFAEWVGAPYAVAVANGTAALHLSALALGSWPGGKVITTPNTFIASANCVRYCGGEVDLVDISPRTWLMDPDALEAKLASAAPGTYQGIIPVDFAGAPADWPRLRALAERHGCWLLEDACHAPGGYFQTPGGQRGTCGSGAWADAAIFSFHPVKHITTGEGGMITTAREDLWRRLQELRNHGITRDPARLPAEEGGWYYEAQALGFNYRLSDLQAALGRSQLRRAGAGLEMRRRLAARYQEALRDLPLRLPYAPEGHAWHLYVVHAPQRRALYDHLHRHQVRVQIHYIPVHYHPVYQALGWKRGDFPHAEAYYEGCLSLPLYPGLSEAGQERVIGLIRQFYGAPPM